MVPNPNSQPTLLRDYGLNGHGYFNPHLHYFTLSSTEMDNPAKFNSVLCQQIKPTSDWSHISRARYSMDIDTIQIHKRNTSQLKINYIIRSLNQEKTRMHDILPKHVVPIHQNGLDSYKSSK